MVVPDALLFIRIRTHSRIKYIHIEKQYKRNTMKLVCTVELNQFEAKKKQKKKTAEMS